MGADIHAYVEYSTFTTEDGEPYWENLTKNFGSRDYYLFGLLAGVRGPDEPVFALRGIPEGRIGYDTADGYWTRVAPVADPQYAEWDGWTSQERAAEWVRRGFSEPEYADDGTLRCVSGPNWHSPSWLTTDELAQVLGRYAAGAKSHWPESKAEAPAEWKAILAAMRSFEADGCKARVIFWFDN